MHDIQDIRIGASGYGVATHGSDAQVIVEFFDGDDIDYEATAKQGRDIYKAVPFIRMMFPGDKNKVIERPVKMVRDAQAPADIERWPMHWQRFQNGQHQQHDGMPLSHWPGVNSADIKNLNGANVFTVEQLASVSDVNLSALGHGALDLRAKAKAYVAQFGDLAAAAKVKGEMSALESSNLQLQEQLNAAVARISELEASKTKKAA